MKRSIRILSIVMAFIFVVCSMPMTTQAASKKKGTVKSVTITNPDTKTLVLKKGKTYKLKTKVTTSGKASKKVTYSSSKKKVATVSKSGKIKALKKGTATITVKSIVNKKKKATLKVIVGIPVTKVKLDKKQAEVTEGETITLKTTISPKKPSVKKLSWESSDNSVATVNSKGVVTAKKAGTATITVKATDGSKKKATCKITVQAKATQDTNQGGTQTPDTNQGGTTQTPDTNQGGTTQTPDTNQGGTTTPDTNPDDTTKPDDTKPEDTIPSYEGYNLVWNDEFNGTELNRDDWNVELHEPGWVNAEWQEYVDSEQNIYLEDGKLVLRPVKTVDEEGNATYTSGRVNTQNKQNFTYGRFEVSAKVTEGKGYLPAFWLMAADENLYGQWPRCGEIDIMEVLGDATNTLHGTIHYGHNASTGHSQSQGTYVLEEGNFSDEFHTFACEWEPGKITWYVDGIKYYEENDWYTAQTDGTGELTYPAPFDQPFYIILNLAVGGSWVGYPDETTDFENQTYEIDYVRVYQKDSYDENVTKPEKEALREPDANGNYLVNGNFEEAEDLVEAKNWQFKTASNGEGNATITNEAVINSVSVNAISGNSVIIQTQNDGDVDYSIQLLQNDVPLMAGGVYELSFDAYATGERVMKVNSKAPNNNWYAYLDETANLTSDKQTYTYEFTMIHEDDANCTVEFNLGNFGSTDTVVIDNVSLKLKEVDEELKDSIINPAKTVRSDGNHIYNGQFQEGTKYLGYWTLSEGADASVTSLADGRRLQVVVPDNETVTLTQENIPVAIDSDYELSLDAVVPQTGTIEVEFDGKTYTVPAGTDGFFSKKLTTTSETKERDITITFHGTGTYYLDNVRIDEDALIKNGSFNAGINTGWTPWADSSASTDWGVDSITYDNAASYTITNTGDADWKIQLKQENVTLEKNQWYRISFDAWSDLERKIMYAFQRNGNLAETKDDWTGYSSTERIVVNNEIKKYSLEFQMTEETDTKSVFAISMGAVDNIQITDKHTVYIDNVILEKIDEPTEVPPTDEPAKAGENILSNSNFENGLEGWITTWDTQWGDSSDYTAVASVSISQNAVVSENTVISGNSVVYDIENVGNYDYSIQLKQEGLDLEEGATYKVSFKAHATNDRMIKFALMKGDVWYGGKDDIALSSDGVTEVSFEVTPEKGKDDYTDIAFQLSLGKMDETTQPSTITLSDFSFVKLDQ